MRVCRHKACPSQPSPGRAATSTRGSGRGMCWLIGRSREAKLGREGETGERALMRVKAEREEGGDGAGVVERS